MQKRCFHSSVVGLARKSGASAFVPNARPLSKKQKKRKSAVMASRAEKVDQKKMKTKDAFMKSQLESIDMAELFAETSADLKGALQDILLPDGTPRLDNGDVQKTKVIREKLDPLLVLYSLRNNKAKQDLLLRGAEEVSGYDDVKPSNDSMSSALDINEIKNNSIAVIDDRDIRDAEIPSGFKRSMSMTMLANRDKFKELSEMVSLMKDLNVKTESSTWATIIATCSKKGRHKLAEDYFDIMIESGVEPTLFTWTALVQAKARGKGPEAALEQVDILQRAGVEPTTYMFTSILKTFIDQNKLDEASDLWIRMHCESCELNKEAFATIMKICVKKGAPERAFFYLDEMQSLRIEPDVACFVLLFRACAEAPHWVDGYHDIIFDAMARMEGAELRPNESIYNAIIYAFSRGGDTVAAEFYFWEMKRKGLRPDQKTYSSLLNAYARSQTVGAGSYGSSGRYVKPADKPPSQMEQDFMDVGATKVVKIMSQGLHQDFNLERGSRQSSQLVDLLDDENEEENEAFRREIHAEANDMRSIRADLAMHRAMQSGDVDSYHIGTGDEEYDKLTDDDTDLQKVMKLIDDDKKKFSSKSKVPAVQENEEEEDDRDFIPLSAEERAVENARLIAEGKLEEGESVGDEDGYAAGEAQYDEWLKANSLEGDSSDLPLVPGTEELNFTDEDREFLRQFELDDNAGKVSHEGGATRELINADELAALMKELGFVDEVEEKKKKDRDVRGGGKYVPGNDKVVAAGMRGAAETMESYERNDRIADQHRNGSYGSSSPSGSFAFSDRLAADTIAKRAQSIEAIELEGRRKQLTNLLDNDEDLEGDDFDRKTRSPGSSSVSTPDSYFKRKMESHEAEGKTKLYSDFSPADIAQEWDQVEFGRAPNPDYSMSIADRRAANIERAKVVFQDLLESDVPLDVVTLTTYMTVYCNAVNKHDQENNVEKALSVFDTFEGHGLKPDRVTYRSLIRMHILKKDIQSALELKEKMIEKGITPDAESYGWLIRSCGHRDLLVEGLKMLEEVTEKGIVVPERHLSHLRSRCETLGIVHPDMTSDPLEWMTTMKQKRRAGKNRNQRKINPMRSALYGK